MNLHYLDNNQRITLNISVEKLNVNSTIKLHKSRKKTHLKLINFAIDI
jgi:hypothetical protein